MPRSRRCSVRMRRPVPRRSRHPARWYPRPRAPRRRRARRPSRPRRVIITRMRSTGSAPATGKASAGRWTSWGARSTNRHSERLPEKNRSMCPPIRVCLVAALVLLAAGCATPVGVSRIDPEAAYRLHTVSALSEGEPSEASKLVLRRLGLMDRFAKEPAAVLAELHRGLGDIDETYRLCALADLSFLHGERTGDRAY